MKFKVCYFLIQNIPTAKTILEKVYGYSDETNTYGFYQNEKKIWTGVDLASGAYICKFKTRKECAEWIENNKILIQEAKNTPKYIGFLKSFIENMDKL